MHMRTLLSVSTLVAILLAGEAVEYTVTNTATGTPGGLRFENEIGTSFAMGVLTTATQFIWTTFEETSPTDRKDFGSVSLFIDDDVFTAYTINNEIHVSGQYIEATSGDLRAEFAGVLYHEMTHVWQWNGNGQTPTGLLEGIADYVRLSGGYAPSHWVKRGEGNSWDQGYAVTAWFLEYCSGLRHGFVADLNRMMKTSYSEDYFAQLVGKSVDQLWDDYKAMYP
ncbi:hypothetical protein MLD38_032442 [Melastoma candidum]|uniref:Uncharacterized protein n=1 Tax=Melastoma candidum TaxID=119954 RepID=A0ACB9M419_9MYRT|nr:hypothetical protein MLD38_032442 [Melastoma candidum]